MPAWTRSRSCGSRLPRTRSRSIPWRRRLWPARRRARSPSRRLTASRRSPATASARLGERAEQLRSEGKTVLYVAAQGRLLGLLAVADRIRPGAPAAVARLHGLGVRVVLLTGDSRATAEAVARSLGIADVRAEVLPGGKATEVRRLEAGGAHVAMVGDGVNDAPALAAASVGIAIGAGTDVAIETAGVVLMRDDPADVATALTLARRVRRKIKQNLFWAAIYNAIAIPVAAGALDRKSTRLNSSHGYISYAVFCLKKKKKQR